MARERKNSTNGAKGVRGQEYSHLLDIARGAILDDIRDEKKIGQKSSVEQTSDDIWTVTFEALLPGYTGWSWVVTLAQLSSDERPTVCDVVLLPGADSLLAPEWIPYSDRITAEDVVAGTIVPTAPDDARLVPAEALLPSDEELDLHELFELGAGRLRVLSIEGRDQAAKRWIEGERGPNSEIARMAPKSCGSCGFYLPISGSLRQAFGVCANAISPEDARVVSVNHGCGAHSEAIN